MNYVKYVSVALLMLSAHAACAMEEAVIGYTTPEDAGEKYVKGYRAILQLIQRNSAILGLSASGVCAMEQTVKSGYKTPDGTALVYNDGTWELPAGYEENRGLHTLSQGVNPEDGPTLIRNAVAAVAPAPAQNIQVLGDVTTGFTTPDGVALVKDEATGVWSVPGDWYRNNCYLDDAKNPKMLIMPEIPEVPAVPEELILLTKVSYL